MKIKIGFSLSAIMLVSSCVAGLKRTNIDMLEYKVFQTLGIRIEMPKKPARFDLLDSKIYQKNTNSKGLMFSMHPVYPAAIAEPVYLINIRFVVLDKNGYALYIGNNLVHNSDRRFRDTNFHEDVTEFGSSRPYDMAGSITLRRDFKNPKTGDVVLAAATYIPDPQHRDKDIDAIKRILNSIEFLDGVRR